MPVLAPDSPISLYTLSLKCRACLADTSASLWSLRQPWAFLGLKVKQPLRMLLIQMTRSPAHSHAHTHMLPGSHSTTLHGVLGP